MNWQGLCLKKWQKKMIKIVEDGLPKAWQNADIAWVKIKALYCCYGTKYSFVDFWLQTNESGETTAVICRFYNGITVSSSAFADLDEISRFLEIIPGKEIFCTLGLAGRLKTARLEKVNILSLTEKATVLRQGLDGTFEQVYEILNSGSDGDIELPAFAEWYPDFAHRLRHKAARYFINADKTAVATTGFETDDFAIICGVAVLPLFRGRGYAADVVEGLCGQLMNENKTVYVAASDRTVGFYKKMGFTVEPTGFAVCKKRGNGQNVF